MTKISVFSPTISEVLEQFFTVYQRAGTPLARARARAVRFDLQQHLEREGVRLLTGSQLAILNNEKQFDAEGAFARTMHAAELYLALEHYLGPSHVMLGLEQRGVQVEVIAALAKSLWGTPGVSERTVSECCSIELDLAIARGREELKAARRLERDLRRTS